MIEEAVVRFEGTPSEVFDFLVDPVKQAAVHGRKQGWLPMRPEELRVGYCASETVPGPMQTEAETEVTAFDPPAHLALRARARFWSFSHDYRVDSVGDTTLVRARAEITFTGNPLRRLTSALAYRSRRRKGPPPIEAHLERIKHLMTWVPDAGFAKRDWIKPREEAP